MKAQGLEAARGEQQDRKAGESDGERAPVAAQASLQAPKGPERGEHRERDPPPGRHAEQKQQHIGYPGAHPPAEVAHLARGYAVRPARVGPVESGEDEGKIEGSRNQDEQPRFAQQRGNLAGKGCLVLFQLARGLSALRRAAVLVDAGILALRAGFDGDGTALLAPDPLNRSSGWFRAGKSNRAEPRCSLPTEGPSSPG